MTWCSMLPFRRSHSVCIDGWFAAQWGFNSQKVCSLTEPLSPISLVQARWGCLNQLSSTHSHIPPTPHWGWEHSPAEAHLMCCWSIGLLSADFCYVQSFIFQFVSVSNDTRPTCWFLPISVAGKQINCPDAEGISLVYYRSWAHCGLWKVIWN